MQKVSVRQKYGELLSLGGHLPGNGGVGTMAMPQRDDTIETCWSKYSLH